MKELLERVLEDFVDAQVERKQLRPGLYRADGTIDDLRALLASLEAPKPVISFIAYRSDGTTSRRNCVIDSWESDFHFHSTTDFDDAVAWLADKMMWNHESDRGAYEFTVLINGADEDAWFDHETDEQREERYDFSRRIQAAAQDQVAPLIAKQKAEKERQEAAKAKAAETARKKSELAALKSRLAANTLEADRARLAELEAELGGNR